TTSLDYHRWVGSVSVLEHQRFREFHSACVEACRTKARFEKEFEVNVQHFSNTLTKDTRRYWFDNEKRAAIILGGKLNTDQCAKNGEVIRVVIEGLIKVFRYVDPTTTPLVEIHLRDVPVRIVVDKKKKKTIVTAYPIDGVSQPSQNDYPEIDYEIW